VLLLLAAGSKNRASSRQEDVQEDHKVGSTGSLLVVKAVVEAQDRNGLFAAASLILQLVVRVEGIRLFSIVLDVLYIVFSEARIRLAKVLLVDAALGLLQDNLVEVRAFVLERRRIQYQFFFQKWSLLLFVNLLIAGQLRGIIGLIRRIYVLVGQYGGSDPVGVCVVCSDN
jgi:hypothetical protein